MTDLVYFLELLPCRSIQRAHVEELIFFSKPSTLLFVFYLLITVRVIGQQHKGSATQYAIPTITSLYSHRPSFVPVAAISMIEGGIFDSRLDVRHFIQKSGNQLPVV